MLGPLLVVIGLLGIYAVVKGKSSPVLDALTTNSFSTSLENALGKLNLGASASGNSSSSGSSSGGGGSSSGGGTSLYNVPIVGPDGTAGTIQVVAHDPASAVQNATQGGNSPTGAAVAV